MLGRETGGRRPSQRLESRAGRAWKHGLRDTVRDNRSLVLYVPSALVHEEENAVLNPAHPEFPPVTMVIERDFQYDARMYQPRAPLGRRSQ